MSLRATGEVERLDANGRVKRITYMVILTALVGSLLVMGPARTAPAGAQATTEPSIVITRPGRTAYAPTVTVEGVVAGVETADVDRVVFVIDTSGSTDVTGNDCDGDGTVGPADDENLNGRAGEVLDCEILAVRTLITELAAQSSIEVAIVRFSSSAAALDIPPGSGDRFAAPATADTNGNGVPDVVDAARTLRPGGGTNFSDALGVVGDLYDVEAATWERWVTFFLSDGFNNQGGAVDGPVARLAGQDTVVNTFSIGAGAAGCGSGDLRFIADETGGVCSEAAPTDVTAVLGQARPGDLDFVEVTFNGETQLNQVQIDAFGRFSADFDNVPVSPRIDGSVRAQLIDGTLVGPTAFSVQVLDQRFEPPPPERLYGNGSLGNDPTARQSDPVNTATGSYLATITDIADQGTGVPFRFSRTYNSIDPTEGDLGRGWLHPLETRLSGLGTGDVTVRGPDGQQLVYRESGGAFTPPHGAMADLSAGGPGGAAYTLLTRDQTLWLFDADGLLVGVEDRNGQGLSIARAPDGSIDVVTDADGATYDFTYGGDRLSGISTSDGRSVAYGYTDGLLTSVTDLRGGTTTYAYTPSGLLAEVVDQNGNLVVRNTYGADGRVVAQEDGRGSVGTFLWDPDAEISTYVDARGNEWRDFYQDGVLIAQRDPLGHEINYDYDDDYNLTLVIDQRGNRWSLVYDDRHNVTSVTGPAPTSPTVTMSYNDFDLPTEVTDANGNTTAYHYEAAANLVGVAYADGTQSSIDIDGSGRPARIADAEGDTTVLSYGSDGNLAAITDPAGGETTFAWDGADHLSASTDPNGNTTARSHDAAGLPSSLTTPLGHRWEWAFDPAGNMVSRTDANGHVTAWTYDPANLLAAVEAADGAVTAYSYDEVRNLISRTDANGHDTTWSHDERNLPTAMTNATGNTWSYAFDPSANLVEVIDANGNASSSPDDGVIRYAYDELDRMVGVDYSSAVTPDVAMAYDPGGRRTAMSDGTGTTTWIWDELDRLAGVEAPTGAFDYDYEADGDLANRTYPDGTEIAHTYDTVGRLLSVSDPEGTVSYAYDLAGRTLAVEFPNGASTFVDYDADDRPTGILTEGPGQAVVSDRQYDYDPVGNPLRLEASGPSGGDDGDDEDGDDHDRPRLGFLDQIFRLLRSLLDRLGLGSRLDFGRRFDRPSEPPDGPGNAWSETLTYEYDAQDRLVAVCYQESCPEPDDPATSWTYDGVGNRLSEASSVGTSTYNYDPADRLTSIIRPDGSVDAFSSSPNGNRTSGPEDTNYTWDQADRLLSAVTPEGNSEYAYDGDGRRIEEVTEAGSRSYAWDHNGALDHVALTTLDGDAEARHTYGNDLVATQSGDESWWHHHDNIGSTTALTGVDGSALASYRFTPWGEERSFEAPGGGEVPANPHLFTGERQDQTGLYHLRARQYDPTTGSFLSLDPVARPAMMTGLSPFAYADNRPTVLVDPSGRTPRIAGVRSVLEGALGFLTDKSFLSAQGHRPVAGIGFLLAFSGAATFYDNLVNMGRSVGESTSRTLISTGLSGAGGIAFGSACAATGVGLIFVAGCAAAGGLFGQVAGDAISDFLYSPTTRRYIDRALQPSPLSPLSLF